MTIDEAIAYAREKAKYKKTKYDKCPTRMRYCCEMCFHEPKCNEVAKEHEQIAKWLEELKMLRELKDEHRKIGNIEGFNKGYNKAIDDFVKFANTMPTVEVDGEIRPMWLEEIAEQLKAGGKNE